MSSVAASLIPTGFPLPIIPDFDIEISLTIKVTYNTCSANAGENTTITPCKNEPIFLFDEMDGSPQSDGVWKGPSGDIISIASITTPNLAGIYTYTYTVRSEEHTSELQSRPHLVCRLLLEKKKKKKKKENEINNK